jgi:hypothetical protein
MNITWNEVVTDKGDGRFNEDRAHFEKDMGWVIDGATGLGEGHFRDTSDAAWFAERINTALQQTADPSLSLVDILSHAVDRVAAEARTAQAPWLDGPVYEEPSAAVGMVRIRPQQVEYLILGDCCIAASVDGGPAQVLTDTRLHTLDQKVIDFVHQEQIRHGLSYRTAKDRALPMLRQHRERMNSPEGYYNVSLRKQGLPHAITGVIPYTESCTVLLATDGFARIVDLFRLYSWDELLHLNEKLSTVLQQLRTRELEDPECLQTPRLKVSDDATAVKFRISR